MVNSLLVVSEFFLCEWIQGGSRVQIVWLSYDADMSGGWDLMAVTVN